MIVCSCNVITKEEIAEIVRDFLRDDEWQLVTVGMVYHAMAKRGKCCGCFPNAISIIVDTVEAWHRGRGSKDAEIICFVKQMRDVHEKQDRKRLQHAA